MKYECAIWITSIVYNRVGIFTKRCHMNSTECIIHLRARRMVAISLKDRQTDCICRYGIVSFKRRLCNTVVHSVFLSTEKPVAQNHSKGWTRNAIYDHISGMWYCAEHSGKSLEDLEGKNDNIYNWAISTLWYNFRMLKYVTQFLNLHDSKMVMETRNLDFVSNQDRHWSHFHEPIFHVGLGTLGGYVRWRIRQPPRKTSVPVVFLNYCDWLPDAEHLVEYCINITLG